MRKALKKSIAVSGIVLSWNGLMLLFHDAQFRFLYSTGLNVDTVQEVVRVSKNMLAESYLLLLFVIVVNVFIIVRCCKEKD